MFSLSSFFLLPLLVSPLTLAATLSQTDRGRLPGTFIDPAPKGDYLTNARCDCFLPVSPTNTNTSRIGFIYQWEYYNFHLNSTFILAYLDNVGPLSQWDNGGWWCRNFTIPAAELPSVPKIKSGKPRRTLDRLCIWPHEYIDRAFDFEDYISWNGQERGLGRYGHQGWMVVPRAYVDREVCPPLCEEFMEAEHKIKGATGAGSKWVWDQLDDMCDGCM